MPPVDTAAGRLTLGTAAGPTQRLHGWPAGGGTSPAIPGAVGATTPGAVSMAGPIRDRPRPARLAARLAALAVVLLGGGVQAQAVDLRLPTTFYVTGAAVDWATSAPACQIGCRSRTGLLPGVSDARVAVPIGVALDVGVLLLTHTVIAARWPKVAEGLLYALTVVRVANAADHLILQRDYNRRTITVTVRLSP